MSKVITLRLSEDVYHLFKTLANSEHRPLSNLIETYALRQAETSQYVDEFEMDEILNNQLLSKSLGRALLDVKKQRGRWVG